MAFCYVVKLWAILAHWCNAFIEYSVLHITFLTKESVVIALKHVKFALLMFAADEKYLFS